MDRWGSVRSVSQYVAVGSLALLAAASVAIALFAGLNRPPSKTAATPPPGPVESLNTPLPAGSYPTTPLDPGTPFPVLQAAGWLNGEPLQPGEPGPRLLVLDIWSHWCPACRLTAPELVRMHEKYSDEQVDFISLTNVDEHQTGKFVEQFEIPWPCGYGATLKSLSRFGAYSAERMSASYNPGYEVSPTIYIIGADGRVLWHDQQARPRHLKEIPEMVSDLEAAIDRLLAV